VILLDTHVLLWVVLGSDRLGGRARRRIEQEFGEGEVAVSAMTYWEIATLVSRKRVEMEQGVAEFRRMVMNLGVAEIVITGEAGIVAGELQAFHGDPADRLLVATALVHEAGLVTADERILAWKSKSPLPRIDARR
jgi:PIN domain nuclease of toxin-antitoxin system